MANSSTYSSEQKSAALAALRANAGCIKGTSARLGIPPSTLRRWRNEAGEKPDPNAEVAIEELARQLRIVAQKILGHMRSEERLAKAGLRDLAIAFGIVMDKLELLGQGDTRDGALEDLVGLMQGLRQDGTHGTSADEG